MVGVEKQTDNETNRRAHRHTIRCSNRHVDRHAIIHTGSQSIR